MNAQEVRLDRMTRREFRLARESGGYRAAIVATGAVEQHLEHLTLGHDIACSTFVAEHAARLLSPDVIVAVPMSIGISEHHMAFGGTLSARPGPWLAVIENAVESLVRHGIDKVLVLNGHGGNVAPVAGAIDQWKLQLAGRDRTHGDNRQTRMGARKVDLRFHSYWDLIPGELAAEALATGQMPGHASEFETAFAMYATPENVRRDDIRHSNDEGAAAATVDAGRALAEKAIDGVRVLVQEMLRATDTDRL